MSVPGLSGQPDPARLDLGLRDGVVIQRGAVGFEIGRQQFLRGRNIGGRQRFDPAADAPGCFQHVEQRREGAKRAVPEGFKRLGVQFVRRDGEAGARVAVNGQSNDDRGTIQAITDAGINVIGHIGLTPQSSGQLGGHKAQGRTAETAKLVVEDALAVEAAGAKMLLVEGVPPEVMKYIWQTLEIPVLSIGAGPHCDGQLLIVSDLIVREFGVQ